MNRRISPILDIDINRDDFKLPEVPVLRTLSLSARLALITIAGTVATVTSVLIIAYSALVEDFEELLTNQQRYETQRIAQAVEKQLQRRIELLVGVAQNLSDGESLYEPAEMELRLARQQILQELFPDGLIVLNDSAIAIAETQRVRGRTGTSYADRAHVQEVTRTRRPVISRPMTGRATGEPVLVFSVPIESDDGRLLGILSGVLKLADTSLVPEQDQRIMRTEGAVFHVIDSNNFLAIDGQTGPGEGVQELPPPGEDPIIDAALSGMTFGQLETRDGRRMIYATRYLTPLGWQLIRAVPLSWATAPAKASFLRFFVISTAIGLTIALLSLIATRSATRRLETMTRQINRMIPSREKARLAETGPSEVRELAHAFNRLMDERDSMATLKENFVSNVSHELRTPLTSINGALRLVLSGALGELPPQLDKMLQLALRNGHRLESLISDLLDFNKLASGRMQVQLQEVTVAALVAEALECNRALAHEHDIRLTQQIDAALQVHADPQRLRQVLDNLITNAIKFSPAGGTITVSAQARNSNRIRVTVSDQGKGVPPEFEPRLFERFAQADESTTRAIRGTGLGLAICRELTELMHGEIGYYFDNGSHFWIELPASANRDSTHAAA